MNYSVIRGMAVEHVMAFNVPYYAEDEFPWFYLIVAVVGIIILWLIISEIRYRLE